MADNFTPLFDEITEKYGIVTSAVYGYVWRKSKLDRGACDASFQTMADDLNISRRTIVTHVKMLVKDGFLTDLTPNADRKPHRYLAQEMQQTREIDSLDNDGTREIDSLDNDGTREIDSTSREIDAPKDTKDTNKNNKTREDEALIALFEGMTGFTAPYETTDNYIDDWLRPAQAIISQSSDFAQAEKRLTFAIQEMRKKRYTIKSIKSLLTFALNWHDGPASNGHANGRINKNELKGNLWQLVTRSKNYQEAKSRASPDEWGLLTKMGKWNDVRHLNETTFSIRFYEVYKQHAGN